jgi:hypothetical protein
VTRPRERLEEAGLPRFASAVHDPAFDLLQISWDNGVTLFMDLTREDVVGPIYDEERATILGRAREIGLLDSKALRSARARVEWRPSLAMLDQVIAEFCG